MPSLVLSTIASRSPCSRSGTLNLANDSRRSSIKDNHSSSVIARYRCESAIDRPEYYWGLPAAQHTISVTRNLNPGGATR
jgi:hypothetical protein